MSQLNSREKQPMVKTHEGALVRPISAEKQLLRLSLANMLWEDQFYVDGKSTAELVKDLVRKVNPTFVAQLALAAREQYKLRHLPLLLARELAALGKLSSETLTKIIQRPDEMAEFLSIYWKDGKTAIANQVKKGLAKAFVKFNEYQFAKWDKNNSAISLRDVMFLTHPKPVDEKQEALFKRIANEELKTPDTWETQLSAGADKRETFTRLMKENKLGALAFLRNLRNMINSGVNEIEIRDYASRVNVEKVLPFRYVAAARHVPQLEDMLEAMMLRSLESHEKLPGKTVLLVDVSGSMFGAPISRKSDLDRFDAASALAMLCREICENVEVYTFSNDAVRVPARRGFALREALSNSQTHGSTALGHALKTIDSKGSYDRLIVFTDEQSYDRPPAPKKGSKGYVINVAAYQNGINHDAWVTISGFSEAVIDYIQELEKASTSF